MCNVEYVCPRCGALIAKEDVNVSKDTALCRACGHALRWLEILEDEESRENMTEIPSCLKVEEVTGGVRLIYRKRVIPVIVFLIFFSLLWNSIIIHATVSKISEMWKVHHGVETFHFDYSVLLMLPFLLAGIGLMASLVWSIFIKAVMEVCGRECEFSLRLGALGKKWRFDLEKGSRILFRKEKSHEVDLRKDLVVMSPEGREVFSSRGMIGDEASLEYIRLFLKKMCG